MSNSYKFDPVPMLEGLADSFKQVSDSLSWQSHMFLMAQYGPGSKNINYNAEERAILLEYFADFAHYLFSPVLEEIDALIIIERFINRALQKTNFHPLIVKSGEELRKRYGYVDAVDAFIKTAQRAQVQVQFDETYGLQYLFNEEGEAIEDETVLTLTLPI